jgi:predicted dehydrogenase
MATFGIGIVGTGFIAGVIADAIARSSGARLTTVSSRKLENALKFVSNRPGAVAVQGIEDLLTHKDVDAVYIACPTYAKEEIALKAVAAGKHILVEKPFTDAGSVSRMAKAASARGLVFMDATHFVHHPRTAAIRSATEARIGTPKSLHTAFYFPFSDPNNIRVDPNQEPMTALGDMAWYSMRAVVEYLRPTGPISRVTTVVEREPQRNAIVRAAGLIAFTDGTVSTYDIGYTAASIVMDLQFLGTRGLIGMDDFVLDWVSSFAFKNPDIQIGYSYRTGMATRKDAEFVPTPASTPQEVAMIDNFAELATKGNAARRGEFIQASLKTQEYLDALWQAVDK